MEVLENKPGWDIPDDGSAVIDPLLECLILLTKFENNPKSADTLCAGLPLVDNQLTPRLFIRAADRSGLSARIVKRRLMKISNLVLPAVLLLDNGQACILKHVDSTNKTVRIIQPDSNFGEKTLELEEIDSAYTGYAIFVQSRHRFDARTPDVFSIGSGHWFWSVLAKSWRIYRDVLMASFLINVFALATPLFVMNVYDRVVPNKAVETLWVLASGVLIIYLFEVVMRLLRGYFIDLASKRADVTLSGLIFERVLGIKMENRPASVGAFANNLRAFESIRDFIASATITTIIDLPFVVLFLFILAFIGGDLVWVSLITIPVILIYGIIIQTKLQHEVEKTFRASSQKNAMLVESLVAIEAIKILGVESAMQSKWEKISGFLANHSVKARLLSSSSTNITTFLRQTAYICVIIFGTYLIASGELSMGGLIACAMLTNRALAPLSQVVSLATQYHHTKAALNSLNSIMNLPIERPDEKTFVARPKFSGKIEFRDVGFTYPSQSPEQNQNLATLSHVSFQIKPGEHVGVVGRVGSGKTTLSKLVLGLFEPQEGAVWLDGIDVRQIDPIHIRHSIGYIPQDLVLFHGTLRENLLYGAPNIDDSALLRTARISGVDAIANQHPLGFDMPIGERGIGLSAGQRQAIAIARALLLSPKVLIMDEPTNSMDHSTEERFRQELKTLIHGKTTLIVTHRASLLSLVDRLIVIEAGKLVADGPKNQVLEVLKQGRQ